MILAVVLVQLSLWVVSTRAFFPWEACRADNSCSPSPRREAREVGVEAERRAEPLRLEIVARPLPSAQSYGRRAPRDFPRLRKKYAGYNVGHEAGLARRKNEYDVLTPAEPDSDNAVGIYQDGNDYAFFVRAELGSEKQPLYMLLDTGAGTTWIMGSECSDHPCTLHDTFDPDTSKTSKDVGRSFDIGYGTGSVGGAKIIDTIRVGPVEVEMEFGVADHTSSHFEHFAFDGILGMSLNKGSTDNFPMSAKEDKELAADMFGVYLDRGSSGSNNGELTLGGINRAKFSGDVTFTDVSSAGHGGWAIQCDDISLDGKSSGVRNRVSYIDTGTSYIFAPADDVEAFHKLVKNAKRVDGETWTVPCDTKEVISFTFSGKSYTVLPQDWVTPPDADGVCWSNIYGHEVVANSWLLGAVFLKNVYSVFKFDTSTPKIGFARLAQQEAPKAPGTASSKAPDQTPPPDTKEKGGPGIDVGGHETGAPATTGTGESQPVSTNSADDENDSTSDARQIAKDQVLAGWLAVMAATFTLMGFL